MYLWNKRKDNILFPCLSIQNNNRNQQQGTSINNQLKEKYPMRIQTDSTLSWHKLKCSRATRQKTYYPIRRPQGKMSASCTFYSRASSSGRRSDQWPAHIGMLFVCLFGWLVIWLFHCGMKMGGEGGASVEQLTNRKPPAGNATMPLAP